MSFQPGEKRTNQGMKSQKMFKQNKARIEVYVINTTVEINFQ